MYLDADEYSERVARGMGPRSVPVLRMRRVATLVDPTQGKWWRVRYPSDLYYRMKFVSRSVCVLRVFGLCLVCCGSVFVRAH